jgi:hypothetical protein
MLAISKKRNPQTNVEIKEYDEGKPRMLYKERLRDLCPLLNTDGRDKMGWTRSWNKGRKKFMAVNWR